MARNQIYISSIIYCALFLLFILNKKLYCDFNTVCVTINVCYILSLNELMSTN